MLIGRDDTDLVARLFPVLPLGVHHGDGSVVIAMVAVRMMEMSGDQVVDVIAVRNRFVAAVGAVNMSRFMATAVVARGTSSGIVLADWNECFVARPSS